MPISQCPSCGYHLEDTSTPCPHCSDVAGASPARGNETVATIIPYRNPMALAAYYCGIFSLIPCLGGLLGILAFVFGIVGLKHVKRHKQAHGTVHAWVGIILGGLLVLAHVVVGGLIAVAVMNEQ